MRVCVDGMRDLSVVVAPLSSADFGDQSHHPKVAVQNNAFSHTLTLCYTDRVTEQAKHLLPATALLQQHNLDKTDKLLLHNPYQLPHCFITRNWTAECRLP